MFPRQIATQLGVTLQQDAIGASGVEGGGFPTWSSQEPITGQIIRIDPNTQQAELWGPQITMTPAFADKDPFLLGRQDFFAAFGVNFRPAMPQLAFLVDY